MANGNTVATIDVTFTNESNIDVSFGEVTEVEKDCSSTIIADLYSAETTYEIGEYVIYNSNLYRCIIAVETAEEFDSEKWSHIKLANDVTLVTEKVADIENDITGIESEINKLKSTTAENADYHLGFYLDENNGLCQVNSL